MFYKGHDIIIGFFIGILRVIYAEFIRDLSRIYTWIMWNLASIVFPCMDRHIKGKHHAIVVPDSLLTIK